jgi:hypothetical protein
MAQHTQHGAGHAHGVGGAGRLSVGVVHNPCLTARRDPSNVTEGLLQPTFAMCG